MKNIHTYIIINKNNNIDYDSLIRSIINQKDKPNIVLITKEHNEITKDLQESYPIGIIENEELINDYNKILEIIKTPYITIIDDEVILDRNYSKYIKPYLNNKNNLIFINKYYIKQNKKIYNNIEIIKNNIIYKLIYKNILKKNIIKLNYSQIILNTKYIKENKIDLNNKLNLINIKTNYIKNKLIAKKIG